MDAKKLNADEFEIINGLTAGLYQGKLRADMMHEQFQRVISTFAGKGHADVVALSAAAPAPSVEVPASVASYVAERVARINGGAR